MSKLIAIKLCAVSAMHAKVRRGSVAGYATDENLVCGPKEHTRWWQRYRGHLQGILYRLILNSYLLIKKATPILIMAFIAASCSNDPEEAFIPGGPLKEMGKDGPRSQSEGLFLPAMAGKAMTRANNDGYADEDSVVAYGSDRTVSARKAKALLQVGHPGCNIHYLRH